MCAASLGARVVAVEPDPAQRRPAAAECRVERLDIAVVEAAAWHESGTVDLVDGRSAKERSVVAGEALPPASPRRRRASEHGTPTLIKLDVEGAEVQALEGARRILAESAPIVVCELHGDEQRARVLDILAGWNVRELDSPDRIAAAPWR